MISTKPWIFGAALAGVALAACGGKAAPSSDSPTPTPAGPTPSTELAPGTTGFPGLDWGDDRAQVKEAYRGAETRGEELVISLAHAGRDGTASFMFTGDALSSITVDYADEYPDMGACADPFHAVEAALNDTLGPSGEDNLAAYWTTETASVTLACNPIDDDGRAELTVSYSMPEPE